MNDELFVFLDERPWPYACKKHSNGQWWLYYWADSAKTFRSMRVLLEAEVREFRSRALPPPEANMYLGKGFMERSERADLEQAGNTCYATHREAD